MGLMYFSSVILERTGHLLGDFLLTIMGKGRTYYLPKPTTDTASSEGRRHISWPDIEYELGCFNLASMAITKSMSPTVQLYSTILGGHGTDKNPLSRISHVKTVTN